MMDSINRISDTGVNKKINMNTNPGKLFNKYLVPVMVVVILVNLFILVYSFYNCDTYNTSLKETTSTAGKSNQSINRKSKRSPDSTSSDVMDKDGLELSSYGFQLVSCEDDSLASALSKVRPAVVYIKTTILKRNIPSGNSNRPSDVSFDSAAGGDTKDSIGSGVIFNSKGYIVTNYHVIAGAEEIEVTPFGYKEKVYKARVVEAFPENDLAILKIDARDGFPYAALGNSDMVEVADTVIAIGSPFGLEYTVTKGIISDEKRDLVIDGMEYKDMIQTDAAINRGNSGGPLVNVDGEVIGINSAIYAPTGIFTGVGFAIPINKVKLMLIRSINLIDG